MNDSDRATRRKKVHDAVEIVEQKREEKYLEGWKKDIKEQKGKGPRWRV